MDTLITLTYLHAAYAYSPLCRPSSAQGDNYYNMKIVHIGTTTKKKKNLTREKLNYNLWWPK